MAPMGSARLARRIENIEGMLEVLAAGEHLYDGEPVNLLEHALQCAAVVERWAPDDVELQVAALVHDIGTVLEPGHPGTHARTGARAVQPLLGARVAGLVGAHDLAKRYLVTVDVDYRSQLSPRSRATLRSQGGLLDPVERRAFLARRDAGDLITLRRADDAAKIPGRQVPALDRWVPALAHVVDARRRERRSNPAIR
jgi:predicted HD phosphohydrolase